MILRDINNTYKMKLINAIILSTVLLVSLSLFNLHQMMITMNPVIRVIENQILLYRIRDYKALETENFIIKYDYIEKEQLQLVAETAEDKYQALKKFFGFEPKKKIVLVVHKDSNRMMSTTMLRKGAPPMGVYYANSVHILEPSQLFGNNTEELFYSEGPVLHEIAHLFTDLASKGNYPMWFTEGVSLYLEYSVDGYVWGQGEAIDAEEYSIENLTKSFSQLNQHLAYTQSFRLVKGFVDKYGEEELIKLINILGEGKNLRNYYHLF